MSIAVGSVLAGLVLLLSGAQALVRGSAAIARRFGLSELLIGMTVVGFGTSAPEMLVAIGSASSGHPDVALGNVVGSNIANIALVLAFVSMVSLARVNRFDVRPDAVAMVIAALVLLGLAAIGRIEAWQGAMLVAALIGYIVWSYRREMRQRTYTEDWHAEEARAYRLISRPWVAFAIAVAGLAALLQGARWLVAGATAIATLAGVPESVVGLTIVAIGTSLPELATSLIAARTGHPDVAVGNVFGSSLFNTLSILGVTAIVASPLPIPDSFARKDIPLMLLASVACAALIAGRGKVTKAEGAIFLIGYVVYVYLLYARP